MNFLLDTNVVSELATNSPHPSVIDWFRSHERDVLYLSMITIGEIQQGIVRLPASQRRQQLTAWFNETLLVEYSDWIIPINNAIMLQ